MKFTYIEVCAGCGGLSYGLECAGLLPKALVEVEKNCIKTLRRNFTCNNIIENDMRKVSFKEYHHQIDILVGGIPCQSYSIAGKREGLENADKGGLFYDFLRILDEIDPLMFMIENVEGLLNINQGETLKFMLTELRNRHFTVDYKLLNALNYHVPQKRKRLIIVGTKYQVKFNFPKQFTNIITIKDALKNVPDSVGISYSEEKKKVLDLIPQGGCWINLPDDIKKNYMGNSIKSGGGKRGIARRLSWNEPSLTLLTSPCQKQTDRCHPVETRPLKTREYARIQTFPDNFIFEGSINNVYKQIGNAVPCMLGFFLGLQIKKCLNKIYKKKLIDEQIYSYLSNNKSINQKLIKYFLTQQLLKIYDEDVDINKNTIDKIKIESTKMNYHGVEELVNNFNYDNSFTELHEYINNNINKNITYRLNKSDQSINELLAIKQNNQDNKCIIGFLDCYNQNKILENGLYLCSDNNFIKMFFTDDYYEVISKIIKKNLHKYVFNIKFNHDLNKIKTLDKLINNKNIEI